MDMVMVMAAVEAAEEPVKVPYQAIKALPRML